ncbi:Alpha/Beta hydrolase protein [Suillus subluteus]|nr:Alpha/Beta hydrolase protein [Suillus subluteus]
MSAAYVDMQCTGASVFPVQSISSCNRMKQALTESCIDQFDLMSCEAAARFCETEISGPFLATGVNPYDLSKTCDGPIQKTLCYPITLSMQTTLTNPPQVGQAFSLAMDSYHATYPHVAALLERGVRALIYVGSYDWICNWLGNQAWTLNMEWSGKEAFWQQSLESWLVEGKVAGKTRSANGLTFATVDGAGHMVPRDKPKEALTMVQRWLAGSGL